MKPVAAVAEPKMAYTLEEARALVGLGRFSFNQAIARGTIRSVALGRRRIVPRQALEDFLNGTQDGPSAA
jgi:excisionase family DNA binding protein